MGLFSSKKKVYVSSSLYNLAGAIEDRPNFIKDVIASHVVSGNQSSMADSIVGSLLTGPGIKFRSFARWARTSGYATELSWDPGEIIVGSNIDHAELQSKITHGPNEEVAIQTAEIGRADYGFWVDQWMLENHPDEVNADYEIDFDEIANVISIAWLDGSKTYTFQPVNFDPLARYLYFSYVVITKNESAPWDEGAEIIVPSPDDWPDTTGWSLVNTINTPRTFDCVDEAVTTVSYSDGRPDEVTTVDTPHTESYTDVANVYEDLVYHGMLPGGSGTSSTLYRTTKTTYGAKESDTSSTSSEETLPGGVIKTTTVVTTVESVGDRYSYKEDTQEIVNDQWSPMHVVIYKQGSGDWDYEQMFAPKAGIGEFVPFIPLRYFNNNVKEDNYPEQYGWNVRATKKAMNKKYSFLMKQLEDNPSLGEIDFAYAVFGVPLNTPDNSAKKYIFQFFQMLGQAGGSGDTEYEQWKLQWAAADATQQAWVKWRDAQANPADPLYGTPEPARSTYPPAPIKKVKAYGKKWNYHMELNWTSITETGGNGLAKPGVKSGDIWFDSTSVTDFNELLISAGQTGERTYESNVVFMYWQKTANTWGALAVTGLWHNYMIYGGKGVDIHGDEAMSDTEESGFLIPLHEDIYKRINLRDATQMATACSFMLLNSYKVVKKKWYTSSWFKIVLIVAAIVVTVVTMGTGSGVGASLLAVASATTAAAAAAAVASLIVSLAVNAIVATLLMQMLTPIATSIFGPEVGAIVAAVGAIVIMSVAGSIAAGGTASEGIMSLGTASDVLRMTNASMTNYSRVQEAELTKIQDKIVALQEEYKAKMSEITEAWKANLGGQSGTIDPATVTEAIQMQYENADSFLARTLLVGSEVAELTNGLIGAFATMTTTTELPV